MKNRRSEKRRHLIYYLQVFNGETDQFLGNLVDITPEGLMLTSERPIETGKNFKLRMNIQFLAQKEMHLDLNAESRWSSTDVNPNYFDTGFRLQDVDSETKLIIDHLIKELGFND